jgi:hypothetical protein
VRSGGLNAQACTVYRHDNLADIDHAILDGDSLRDNPAS